MGSGKWTIEKVYASLLKRLRFYVAAGISPFPTFGDVPARGPNLPSPTSGGSVRRPSAGRLWTGRPVDFSPTESRRVARTQARCRPGSRNCAESDSSVALRGSSRVGDSVRALGQLKRRSQVSRQRRADVDRRAGDGVLEREPLGMQELALEPVAARDPVLTITADRMTDRRHVHTDLVGAAGLQDHPQQR